MLMAGSVIIGLKEPVHEPCKADTGSEFLDVEQSSVRRKVAAIKINFD